MEDILHNEIFFKVSIFSSFHLTCKKYYKRSIIHSLKVNDNFITNVFINLTCREILLNIDETLLNEILEEGRWLFKDIILPSKNNKIEFLGKKYINYKINDLIYEDYNLIR